MSFCECGGYLGSGGVDMYAGRWCRCANPKMAAPAITTTRITLSGTGNELDEREQEIARLKEELEVANLKLKKTVKTLKFYADWQNYEPTVNYRGLRYISAIGSNFKLGEDNGKEARKILEEIGEGSWA